jgi:HSP20 family protein
MNRLMTRWEPFTGLTRLNETFKDFFNDFWTQEPEEAPNLMAPAIDVSEDQNRIMVTAELPGMERKDVQVELKNGVLMMRGEKKQETESKDKQYHRVERRYGAFYRALVLPETAETGKIDATLKNGVLTVLVPKREEAKPKQIQVKE